MGGHKDEEVEALASEFDQKMCIQLQPERHIEVPEEVVDMGKFKPRFIQKKKKDVKMQDTMTTKVEQKVSVDLGEDMPNIQSDAVNEDKEMKMEVIRFGKRKPIGNKRQ